jgi:hypothetical protein
VVIFQRFMLNKQKIVADDVNVSHVDCVLMMWVV